MSVQSIKLAILKRPDEALEYLTITTLDGSPISPKEYNLEIIFRKPDGSVLLTTKLSPRWPGDDRWHYPLPVDESGKYPILFPTNLHSGSQATAHLTPKTGITGKTIQSNSLNIGTLDNGSASYVGSLAQANNIDHIVLEQAQEDPEGWSGSNTVYGASASGANKRKIAEANAPGYKLWSVKVAPENKSDFYIVEFSGQDSQDHSVAIPPLTIDARDITRQAIPFASIKAIGQPIAHENGDTPIQFQINLSRPALTSLKVRLLLGDISSDEIK